MRGLMGVEWIDRQSNAPLLVQKAKSGIVESFRIEFLSRRDLGMFWSRQSQKLVHRSMSTKSHKHNPHLNQRPSQALNGEQIFLVSLVASFPQV